MVDESMDSPGGDTGSESEGGGFEVQTLAPKRTRLQRGGGRKKAKSNVVKPAGCWTECGVKEAGSIDWRSLIVKLCTSV